MHAVLQNILSWLSRRDGMGLAVFALGSWLPWQCGGWRLQEEEVSPHEVCQGQALAVRAVPLPQAGSGHLGSKGSPSSGNCAPSWGWEQTKARLGHGPAAGGSGWWQFKAMTRRGGIQVDIVHRSFSWKASLTAGEGAPLRPPSRDIWESWWNILHCFLLRWPGDLSLALYWTQTTVPWGGGDSGARHWPTFLAKLNHHVLTHRLTTEQLKSEIPHDQTGLRWLQPLMAALKKKTF